MTIDELIQRMPKIKRADSCDREELIALRRRLLEVCGLREIQ